MSKVIKEEKFDYDHLEYADYDVFKPVREIDVIIEDKLYIGE